ncbi:MAG: hypothetical protein QW429_06445, partial [Thermoprotei archaeon]
MEKKQNGLKIGLYVVLAALLIATITPTVSLLNSVSPVGAVASSGATLTVTPSITGAGNAVLLTTSPSAFTGGSVNVYISNNNEATISGATLIYSNLALQNHALTDVNVTIPSTTQPGHYYIKITDDNGATVVVSNQLTILPPPFAPTLTAIDYNLSQELNVPQSSGYVGDTINVCGQNFALNEPVTIDFIGPTGVIDTSTTTTSVGHICGA